MRTVVSAARPRAGAGLPARAVGTLVAAAAVVLAAPLAAPAMAGLSPAHAALGRAGHACVASGCTLAPPTPAEADALRGEADRLLARYADDATALGRQCRALGARMRAGADAVRMLPYMWRAADPDGNVGLVSGDSHTVEPEAGAGVVHIARGVDALNPDRGLAAIVQTARHEFAHLALYADGVRQTVGWSYGDPAGALAAACAPAVGDEP